MSFEEYEESRTLGQPDALYRFTIGDLTLGYTDAEDAVTYAGVTYQPIPIDRDAITSSGTLDKSALNVRVPHDTAIAEMFKIFPPSEVVGLTIFSGHGGDSEWIAVWVGRVLSCVRDASEAALSCEPINTSMRRVGLRMRDQYQCMHALYGTACGVNREAFTVTTTVLSVSGSFVTLPGGWNGPHAEDRFTNGIARWSVAGGAMQLPILQVQPGPNRLRLGGVLLDLEPGMSIALSRGCTHNMGAGGCADFNNVQNFGGCPFIPKRNPLGTVNQYY